jgi:threonine/homoserine/homoserine lactone efflux protein
VRGALGARPTLGRWFSRSVGTLFIALGLRLAVFDDHGH